MSEQMKPLLLTKVIEVSGGDPKINPLANYGRFMIAQATEELRNYPSQFNPGHLIWGNKRIITDSDIWVIDLITGEGGWFNFNGSEPLVDQLEKHQFWCCVLLPSFLAWIDENFPRSYRKVEDFPDTIIVEHHTELVGFRHGANTWYKDVPPAVLLWLAEGGSGIVPMYLRHLIKRILPNTNPYLRLTREG